MSDFQDRVVKPIQEAEAHITELGILPEINEAAANLQMAIQQTGAEIAGATFAARFIREVDETKALEHSQSTVSPMAREAIMSEGEAGLKRLELRTRLQTIEGVAFRALSDLIKLRADLKISQQD